MWNCDLPYKTETSAGVPLLVNEITSSSSPPKLETSDCPNSSISNYLSPFVDSQTIFLESGYPTPSLLSPWFVTEK